MDADGEPQRALPAEQEERRADVLDRQVEELDVERVQALRVLADLVVEAVEMIPT